MPQARRYWSLAAATPATTVWARPFARAASCLLYTSLPVDGIVIVSSPQELVGMIVGKAVQMAQMMNVPILGLVENMSYVLCPDCGKHINVFGDSHVDEIAAKYKLPVLAKMPIDPELAKEADAGMIEVFAGDYLDNAAQTVAKLLKK